MNIPANRMLIAGYMPSPNSLPTDHVGGFLSLFSAWCSFVLLIVRLLFQSTRLKAIMILSSLLPFFVERATHVPISSIVD